MEWVAGKTAVLDFLRKYKFAVIILLIGMALLLLPTEEKKTEVSEPVVQKVSLQETLEEILGKISGAGRVSVLLTQAAGEETIYQLDESISAEGSGNSTRRDTVLVSGTGREEAGLIRQVKAPTYQGAVVVCQGADNAVVRLAVVEAVRSATGLTSDRISVLKMK